MISSAERKICLEHSGPTQTNYTKGVQVWSRCPFDRTVASHGNACLSPPKNVDLFPHSRCYHPHSKKRQISPRWRLSANALIKRDGHGDKMPLIRCSFFYNIYRMTFMALLFNIFALLAVYVRVFALLLLT